MLKIFNIVFIGLLLASVAPILHAAGCLSLVLPLLILMACAICPLFGARPSLPRVGVDVGRKPSPRLVTPYQYQVRRHFGTHHGCLVQYPSSMTASPGGHFKNVLLPDNLEVTPAPDATPLSVTETQDFLARVGVSSFSGKWHTIILPPVLSTDFEMKIIEYINALPKGKAYAVLFSAQGEGRYATLGPSFIISADSDPATVIQHLRDNHHFVCENSRGTFDEMIVCRWKYLGKTSRTLGNYFRNKVPSRPVSHGKAANEMATVADPIPTISIGELVASLKQRKAAALELFALTSWTPRQLRETGGKYDKARAALEEVGIGPVEGFPEWAVSSWSSIHITLSHTSGSTITAAKLQHGWEGQYASANGSIVIQFTDWIDVVEGHGNTIRRDIKGLGALWYDRQGRTVKFEHKFNSRRLISGCAPESSALSTRQAKLRGMAAYNPSPSWIARNVNNPNGIVFTYPSPPGYVELTSYNPREIHAIAMYIGWIPASTPFTSFYPNVNRWTLTQAFKAGYPYPDIWDSRKNSELGPNFSWYSMTPAQLLESFATTPTAPAPAPTPTPHISATYTEGPNLTSTNLMSLLCPNGPPQ